MEEKDKDRFKSIEMARNYDKFCHLIVPAYDFMQDSLIDILKFEDIKPIVLLDLGAGSGIFIEKILNEFPDSKCYHLDSSDDFRSIAWEKLGKYGDRVTYINSSFTDDWESQIKERPNVITSMSAIHHLSNDHKKKLYKKCFDVLQEDGWFFNTDEMKTLNEDAYRKSLYYWIYHTEKVKETIPDKLIDSYLELMEDFDNWKKRNVYNINTPKKEGDDIHESFLTQLNWLDEIGFKETDVFFKYFLWSMIGGKK